MVFVVTEHGNTIATVTLEDVIEQLVGEVQNEFDSELPSILPDGENQFIVFGRELIEQLNEQLGLSPHSENMDSLSGLLIEHIGKMLTPGITVELSSSVSAKVQEVNGNRATRIQLIIRNP